LFPLFGKFLRKVEENMLEKDKYEKEDKFREEIKKKIGFLIIFINDQSLI